jgi:hypothetical protein
VEDRNIFIAWCVLHGRHRGPTWTGRAQIGHGSTRCRAVRDGEVARLTMICVVSGHFVSRDLIKANRTEPGSHTCRRHFLRMLAWLTVARPADPRRARRDRGRVVTENGSGNCDEGRRAESQYWLSGVLSFPNSSNEFSRLLDSEYTSHCRNDANGSLTLPLVSPPLTVAMCYS